MSYSKPLIGLSDSQFDADLHKNEIDHDFFDNPCASADIHDKNSNQEDSASPVANASRNNNSTSENSERVDRVPKVSINSEQIQFESDSCETKSAGTLSLSFKNMASAVDELVTPDTCVSSPNAEFLHNSQQIFSTGKLLECLQQSNLDSISRPNSSYFDEYFRKYQTSEGSSGESGIMTHETAATDLESEIPVVRRKLFDLSSSSSDSSDSEDGSDDSLDTEDEEFVKLLGKYYDYLGESDVSDITEVSPMSSCTASPLPPTNGPASVEELQFSGDKADGSIASGSGSLNVHDSRRFPSGSHGQTYKGKPLPPLIIHTMEEVSASNLFVTQSGGIGIPINGNSIPENSRASSLLMKVEHDTVNNDPDPEPLTPTCTDYNSAQSTIEYSHAFPTSNNSEISTPSRVSFRSVNSGSCSSRAGSSFSSSSLMTANKKSIKNHSFTPDQLRRIERDNSTLLRRILDTSKTHSGHHWSHSKAAIHHHRFGHHPSLKASATIARQRQQRRIDHENSILVRRLQNAKPSKEIVDAFRTSGATSNVY